MSQPSSEEIAALLALPVGAREALAKCEGPGWLLDPHGGSFAPDVPVPFFSPPTMRDGMAWLPCDTAAILDVASERIHKLAQMERHNDGFRRTWLTWVPEGEDHWVFTADTSRLAALRLLAAVWGAE